MILKVIILAALIRILFVTGKPMVCSGIYTAVVVFFGMAMQGPSLGMLIVAPIVFALSTVYFWLLNRFQDNTVLFWVIAILGLLIGFV